MNFLSHFYFERFYRDPELVLGSVFPDLLKNAEPKVHLFPYKQELQFLPNPKMKALYEGWQRHLHIDKIFHVTPFFYEHVHELKKQIQPILVNTQVRPSFLAHIGLELLLDHLLLKHKMVDVEIFYKQLDLVDRDAVKKFLNIAGLEKTDNFFNFYDSFLQSRYVGTYADLDQIAKALIFICKRVWDFKKEDISKLALQEVLENYSHHLEEDFKSIFVEIETQIW